MYHFQRNGIGQIIMTFVSPENGMSFQKGFTAAEFKKFLCDANDYLNEPTTMTEYFRQENYTEEGDI